MTTLQMILGGLYLLQLSWYLTRGTPEEDAIATYPFDAGGWTDLLGVLGGIAWYMIAFAVPLAFLLGMAGGLMLTFRRARLSAISIGALAIGTAICAVVLAVGLTPFGRGLWAWWLD